MSADVWRREQARRQAVFWLLMAVGLSALALDELGSLHERAARRLAGGLAEAPLGLNHTDDLVLMVTAFAGGVVLASFAREAFRERAVASALAAAAVLLGAAVVIDGYAPVEGVAPVLEETLEIAGVAACVAAVWLRRRSSLAAQPATVTPRGAVRAGSPPDLGFDIAGLVGPIGGPQVGREVLPATVGEQADDVLLAGQPLGRTQRRTYDAPGAHAHE
jgi:hypothetical protein